jgi:hypothetical protein
MKITSTPTFDLMFDTFDINWDGHRSNGDFDRASQITIHLTNDEELGLGVVFQIDDEPILNNPVVSIVITPDVSFIEAWDMFRNALCEAYLQAMEAGWES